MRHFFNSPSSPSRQSESNIPGIADRDNLASIAQADRKGDSRLASQKTHRNIALGQMEQSKNRKISRKESLEIKFGAAECVSKAIVIELVG